MRARRVFLADVRDNDQYLRATWHPDTAVVVMSHWVGDVCVASTPVGVAELSTLIELLVTALQDTATRSLEDPPTPAPPPPPCTRAILERLRRHVQPRLARVVDLRLTRGQPARDRQHG